MCLRKRIKWRQNKVKNLRQAKWRSDGWIVKRANAELNGKDKHNGMIRVVNIVKEKVKDKLQIEAIL